MLAVTEIPTSPIEGQKPGTSGLRKSTATFMGPNYLQNFVQSTLNALPAAQLSGGTLVVSGDGRYFMPEAVQVVIKMAAAAGVDRIWVGQHGLLSTPAVSAVIRNRKPAEVATDGTAVAGGKAAFGGFILTASHNPGGPDGDFGVKYNCENGGPAPEKITDAIFAQTQALTTLRVCAALPDIDLGTPAVHAFSDGGGRTVVVEVFDAAEDHVALLRDGVFDFGALKALLARPDFSMAYDCMHGVQGPYAVAVLQAELGAPASACLNAVPSPTFGGVHADPNLTYAEELIEVMHVTRLGTRAPHPAGAPPPPDFGAAADGDADRNMILGAGFFVTPSDSVAIITAYAERAIPFFRQGGAAGPRAVARSMPTSGALDRVAAKLGITCFEVPTGWKFFGNLMDSATPAFGGADYTPFVCGEESFGTGANHVREKDGLWAVLAWLSILAFRNADASVPLVSVEQIVREHWAEYGRNYYCRYDYEGVDKAGATAMMARLVGMVDMFNLGGAAPLALHGNTLVKADEFCYTDPVDGSVSAHQGIRFIFGDGSRIVFRLSGTGVAGATVRMYLERYVDGAGDLGMPTADALATLVAAALELSQIEQFTGRTEPSVIT